MTQQAFAFMGGTFDPVHNGHLRTALEIQQWLEVDQVCLIPSKMPVHRDEPGCTSEQRLAMVQAAVEDEPSLAADDCEIRSLKPSYSVLTLQALRQRIGTQAPLCMIMGMDAYLGLNRWHQWQQIPELAHIIVVTRPGYQFEPNAEMAEFTARHRVDSKEQILDRPGGQVLIHELTPLGISATQVRQQVSRGESPRYLLPDPVWHYIRLHRLYGYQSN